MKRGPMAALAMVVLAVPAAAGASETISYTYDTLGRLTAVQTSGGPNAGQSVGTVYDSAGNRTNYNVSGAGPWGQSVSAPIDGAATEGIAPDDEDGLPLEEGGDAPQDSEPSDSPDEIESAPEQPDGAAR